MNFDPTSTDLIIDISQVVLPEVFGAPTSSVILPEATHGSTIQGGFLGAVRRNSLADLNFFLNTFLTPQKILPEIVKRQVERCQNLSIYLSARFFYYMAGRKISAVLSAAFLPELLTLGGNL